MQFVHIMLECCTAGGGEAELLVAEWWDWKAEGRGEIIPRNFPRATTSHNNKIECESVTVSVCLSVCAASEAKPLGRFPKLFFQVLGLVLEGVRKIRKN